MIRESIINKIDHMAINRVDMLTDFPNIIGFGRGYKKINGRITGIPSLTFFVTNKIGKKDLNEYEIIPNQINGIQTDVIEIERIRAASTMNIVRPMLGGISIGNSNSLYSGTLACAVRDDDNFYMLSTNHVLARCNQGRIGEIIVQPGVSDGGGSDMVDTIVGRLSRFIPIKFIEGAQRPENTVDCAIALVGPVHGTEYRTVTSKLIRNGILNIGDISGYKFVEPGEVVMKTGKSSGYNVGVIKYINASILVDYEVTPGVSKEALFTRQIVAEQDNKLGDSGSLGVTVKDNKAFGLLFASGSGGYTFYNPLSQVLYDLNVAIDF